VPSALVTGARGGLGHALAERLLARGYDVAVTDIDEAATAKAAEGLGERAWPLHLDVTDAEACDEAAAKVVKRSGSLDLWINNAGILVPGVVYEQAPTLHRAMLEVNAIGTFNGTRAALEVMLAAGRGHVINVISLAGLIAAPGEVAYSASKHAAIAYSIGTLADLRRSGIKNIHVSCLCPSGIWSPMLEDKLDDPDAAASFSGTMHTPQEVAERAERLLDHPKPVMAVPRWRGGFVRFFDLFPGLAMRGLPLMMSDARRRQARFRKKIQKGEWPPK
jgi:NAD(P)-dependent dehydrogenase (short-subunit alcohol dehydrogenase family)